MSSGLDMTAHDAALKQIYTTDHVEDMTYRKNPFFALCPKFEGFKGKNLPIVIIYGNPQGRSKTFSNAQTRSTATSTKSTDFVLTRKKDYSIATIDGETMDASEGAEASFIDGATAEIDGAINSLTRSLAIGLFRDSSAAVGQVSAEPSTNASTFEITLKSNDDACNFEIGQVIKIYSAKSGGSVRTSDGTDDEWEITAVNRGTTGKLTVSGSYDASGDIAADDYIFVEGDRGNGISGLEDWNPDDDPDSTTFFGVNRSVDPTRLAGHRIDVSAMPIEEALIEGDAAVGRDQFQIDHYFMSHNKLKELKKSLGSKVNYVNLMANPRIGFQGVLVDGNNGQIKCVADQNCPDNRTRGLAMEFVKFYSLGKAVKCLDGDGMKMLRQTSDDGYEVRYGSYSQFGCRAPGSLVNLQWD